MTGWLLVMSDESLRSGRLIFHMSFVISHLPFEIDVRSLQSLALHTLEIIPAYQRKRRFGSQAMANEK